MYRRILVPIDGSNTATRGLTEAIGLAADQHASLRIVHVISDAYVNAVLMGGMYSGDVLGQMHDQAEAILREAAAAASHAGVAADTRLLEHQGARIGELIIAEAASWQADLIVMGTHGRGGLARAALGSDAEHVVRHATLPVLLLRAR